MSGGNMPQASLNPIACDGIPYCAADHKADAGSVIQTHGVDHQRGSTHADPSPGRVPEVLGAPHSQRSRQHRVDSTSLRRTGGRGPYDAGPK